MAELKCKVLPLGYAIGLVCGIYVLFLGLVAWIWGWSTPLVNTLSSYYIGFGPTLGGSILGFIWGAVDGFIAGVLIAVFYNKFSR